MGEAQGLWWEQHLQEASLHPSDTGEVSISAQSLLLLSRKSQAEEKDLFRAKWEKRKPFLTLEHCQLLLQIFLIAELWVTEKFLKQLKEYPQG